MSSISLKSNKPEPFDGTRVYLTVNTWIYSIEKYLSLSKIRLPNTELSDHNKKAFASSYLKDNATVWWCNIINSPCSPTTCMEFRNVLMAQFIPADHILRARYWLRKLRQTTSVEKYLVEYRNIVLKIADLNEGEKLDRDVEELIYHINVEVMKYNWNSFKDCATIALNVDSDIWQALRGPFNSELYNT